MSVHPEDAMAYADQLHSDLADVRDAIGDVRDAIGDVATALERFTELFALVLDGERSIPITSDRP